jgi:hypothetical protein
MRTWGGGARFGSACQSTLCVRACVRAYSLGFGAPAKPPVSATASWMVSCARDRCQPARGVIEVGVTRDPRAPASVNRLTS